MPAHRKLEDFIDDYITAAGIRDAGKSLLFCPAVGRMGRLSDEAMHRIDASPEPSRLPVVASFPTK
jgi:hypothetical protein